MQLGKIITAAALAVVCLTPLTYATPGNGNGNGHGNGNGNGHGNGHGNDGDTTPVSVPEIDAGTASTALVLLAGALTLFYARRRQ
jgi:hypothetical protein